jgi:hypothetical protein
VSPGDLVAPGSGLPYPAPHPLLAGLRLLGFVLHVAMMNLWLAGLPAALVLQRFGGEPARRLSARLLRALPVVVALGINFGIVPLLFLQVTHGQLFYPATVLMAWPWFGVVGMLILAYAGVYLCALGVREGDGLSLARLTAGWAAAALFAVIALVFSAAMTLLADVGSWEGLWREQQVAGASLGVALPLLPDVPARWAVMFSLALLSTATWVVFDAAFLDRRADDRVRRYAVRVGFRIATLGLAGFAGAGTLYTFGTWPDAVRARMLDPPLLPLTVATALAPGLPWLLLVLGRRRPTRRLAGGVLAAQLLVLALNAGSRFAKQQLVLAPHFDPAARPVETQTLPLVLFLVLFVLGIASVGWMIARAAREVRTSP